MGEAIEREIFDTFTRGVNIDVRDIEHTGTKNFGAN